MTDAHLTPADFAAVPWGGRAIPPEGSSFTDAIRTPWASDDTYPWAVRGKQWSVNLYSDSQMVAEGWTFPAPTDPWDALPDALQAAWDAGEVRDGENGERYVFRFNDGSLASGVTDEHAPAHPKRRFRPRPRPSWQDAEVVEASTESNPERRLFRRVKGGGWVDDSWFQSSDALIDPVPMTVQKKEER